MTLRVSCSAWTDCRNCMTSAANKSFVNSIFCGSLMEDKAEDYDFDYRRWNKRFPLPEVTIWKEATLWKSRELMERKQGHNLHFKLKHKIYYFPGTFKFYSLVMLERRDGALEAEQRNAAWYRRPDRSAEEHKYQKFSLRHPGDPNRRDCPELFRIPRIVSWDIETSTVETVTQDMLRCPDAPVKNNQTDWYSVTQAIQKNRKGVESPTAFESRATNCIQIDRNSSLQGPRPKEMEPKVRWKRSWHDSWKFPVPLGSTARIVWPQPSLSWIPSSVGRCGHEMVLTANGGQGPRLRFWLLFVDTGGGTSVFHYRKWPYERKRPYESQEN